MVQRSYVVLLMFVCLIMSGCARTINNHFGALPPEAYIVPPLITDVDITQQDVLKVKGDDAKAQRQAEYAMLLGCSEWQGRNNCKTKGIPIGHCGALATLMQADIKTPSDRNALISEWRHAIVLSHGDYLGRVSGHHAGFDAAADLTALGVTAASAVSPSAALGATATGVTGAKASIDKNFYGDLSRLAQLSAALKGMNKAQTVLDTKMLDNLNDYPMTAACDDLSTYYRSASVVFSLE